MKGGIIEMDALVTLFGSTTLSQLIVVIAAIVFLFKVYKQLSIFIVEGYKKKETQENAIKELQKQQGDISSAVKKLTTIVEEIKSQQDKIDKEARERELNRLRDQLYQKYRYYKKSTDDDSWTQSERDIWMMMFNDYEKLGGNGDMHKVVKPFMDLLSIVPDH